MKSLYGLILFCTSLSVFAAQPGWVKSYGLTSLYPSSRYITGFSMIDKGEYRADLLAKESAQGELAGKIQTMVFSEITLRETDDSLNHDSSVSMVTKNTVNISVSNVEYLVHRDENYSYALAYVKRNDLTDYYKAQGEEILLRIKNSYTGAQRDADNNKINNALKSLYAIGTSFINFYEKYTLTRAVNENTNFFRSLSGFGSLKEVQALEGDVSKLIDELEDRTADSLQAALKKVSLLLGRQDVTGGNLSVSSLCFETTTFSSEFGRYASALLESELVEALNRGYGKTLIRGNYWLEGNTIKLRALAINEKGNKTGQAFVRFPVSSIPPRYSLKPQNFEESMLALREFADGALTDGGINLNIWTNKGRDDDSLVYEEGETLQLFLRVNQPASVQLTYKLATGEMVLLERAFYIGIDRVNRAVKLPYDFEVKPPLGIEQLIATAYSVEPPEPDTVMARIEGELYEVFTTNKAITAGTRGLKRKRDDNKSDVRVGEAMLSLTTVRR